MSAADWSELVAAEIREHGLESCVATDQQELQMVIKTGRLMGLVVVAKLTTVHAFAEHDDRPLPQQLQDDFSHRIDRRIIRGE